MNRRKREFWNFITAVAGIACICVLLAAMNVMIPASANIPASVPAGLAYRNADELERVQSIERQARQVEADIQSVQCDRSADDAGPVVLMFEIDESEIRSIAGDGRVDLDGLARSLCTPEIQ